jgi:hypothetical protein
MKLQEDKMKLQEEQINQLKKLNDVIYIYFLNDNINELEIELQHDISLYNSSTNNEYFIKNQHKLSAEDRERLSNKLLNIEKKKQTLEGLRTKIRQI